MGKRISWSIEKYNDWYFLYLYPETVTVAFELIVNQFTNKNVLVLPLWDNFIKYYIKNLKKLDLIKDNIIHINYKMSGIMLSDKNLHFMQHSSTFYEFVLIDVPTNYTVEQIKSLPTFNHEGITQDYDLKEVTTVLENFGSTILFNKYDGQDIRVFSKNKDFIEDLIYSAIEYLIKDLLPEIRKGMTKEVCKKLYYYTDYIHMDDNFEFISSDTFYFHIYTDQMYNEEPKKAQVRVNKGTVTIYDWEDIDQSDLPGETTTMKSDLSCLLMIVVFILVVFLIGYGIYLLFNFVF